MKTHYIFCCDNACVFKKMREFRAAHKGYAQTIMSSHTILWRGCAYIFIEDVNANRKQIEGLTIDSFEICTNYKLSLDVVEAIIQNDKKETDMCIEAKAIDDSLVQKLIKEKCEAVKQMLLNKNREYGDSAIAPLRIFSSSDNIEQINVRIDDKLSRISTAGEKNIKEDTELDLMGYLVLKRVAKSANGRPSKAEKGSDRAIKHIQGLIAAECERVKDKLIQENKDRGDSAVMPLRIFSNMSNIERLDVKMDEEISIVFNTEDKATAGDAEMNLIGHMIMKRVIGGLEKC